MSPLPPNPTLKQLQALIGEWEIEVPQFPGQRGRAIFEWLEGGAFLRFHSDAPDPAPSATLIIGRDDSSGWTAPGRGHQRRVRLRQPRPGCQDSITRWSGGVPTYVRTTSAMSSLKKPASW